LPKLRGCIGHPLAIGRYQVFLVGEHPVETAAACDYVLERRVVEDPNHVVAISSGELVCGKFTIGPVGHKVVTFFAYYIVGTQAANDCIVARPPQQVLVAAGEVASLTTRRTADNDILTPPS